MLHAKYSDKSERIYKMKGGMHEMKAQKKSCIEPKTSIFGLSRKKEVLRKVTRERTNDFIIKTCQ